MLDSEIPVNEAVEEFVSSRSGEKEIRDAVRQVIEQESEMVEEQGMHAQGALMGQVMQEVNADGGTVSRILQEELEREV